jgi:hypothetical protein
VGQLTVDADRRRDAGGEVEVGAAAVDQLDQQRVEVDLRVLLGEQRRLVADGDALGAATSGADAGVELLELLEAALDDSSRCRWARDRCPFVGGVAAGRCNGTPATVGTSGASADPAGGGGAGGGDDRRRRGTEEPDEADGADAPGGGRTEWSGARAGPSCDPATCSAARSSTACSAIASSSAGVAPAPR